MGAKTWMLVYSKSDVGAVLKAAPPLDRAATEAFVRQLFPKETLTPLEDGSLDFTCPPDDELVVGCFGELAIVAAKEFAIDKPSKLPSHFLDLAGGRTVHLHAMHSVVDWLAFAVWQGGVLQRALSLSPDDGILEDQGPRLPFELPFWDGRHPATDPDDEDDEDDAYPFCFHPLELGEAALLAFFGYQLEGMVVPDSVDAGAVPMMRFTREKRRWWKW